MRLTLSILGAFLLFATVATAGDDYSVEELAARNRELEERVQKLERESLDEDIANYLDSSGVTLAAEGGDHSVSVPNSSAIRFSGQLRFRFEMRDHNYSPLDPNGQNSFSLVFSRVRLRTDIDITEKILATIEIQDVRTWGQAGSTVGVLGSRLDLKLGNVVFKDIGDGPVSVQVGRMVLIYGDERLVGALEWVNQGRMYDGIRVMVDNKEKSGWWVDLFGVNVRETAPLDDDQIFTGAYGGWKWLELYALAVLDNLTMAGEVGSGHTKFVTLGFRATHKTGNWDFEVEVPFQVGKLNGEDLSAWAAVGVVGYTFADAKWKPRLFLEVAYASGDKNATDGKSEQFQTLFPTAHKFYGLMDLVGWSNIVDFRLAVRSHPGPKFKLFVEYHYFYRPQAQGAWVNAAGAQIRPGVAGSSKQLGQEVDLVFIWQAAEPATIFFGYSIFLPGDFVAETGLDPTSHFFWVQALVKF